MLRQTRSLFQVRKGFYITPREETRGGQVNFEIFTYNEVKTSPLCTFRATSLVKGFLIGWGRHQKNKKPFTDRDEKVHWKFLKQTVTFPSSVSCPTQIFFASYLAPWYVWTHTSTIIRHIMSLLSKVDTHILHLTRHVHSGSFQCALNSMCSKLS